MALAALMFVIYMDPYYLKMLILIHQEYLRLLNDFSINIRTIAYYKRVMTSDSILIGDKGYKQQSALAMGNLAPNVSYYIYERARYTNFRKI